LQVAAIGGRDLCVSSPKDIAEYKAFIVGSGFGGQCAALALRHRGVPDLRVVERRDFMGGTWSQTSYPGVDEHVCSPLYSIGDEPHECPQIYADQAELDEYTNHVLNKYGTYDVTGIDTNVERATWDECACHWFVQTSDIQDYHALFAIPDSGPRSNTLMPEFEARGCFDGTSFHTNGWDSSYDYHGKRVTVTVIGSGASAAQGIPATAPEVEHLHVFQRAPHWIVPRLDRVFSKLGRFLLRSDFVTRVLRTVIDWNFESRVLSFKYSTRLLGILGARPALKQPKQTPPIRSMVSVAERLPSHGTSFLAPTSARRCLDFPICLL
jgi:cation diffusion facilitator CzcD-associated flavoprotein CzcO